MPKFRVPCGLLVDSRAAQIHAAEGCGCPLCHRFLEWHAHHKDRQWDRARRPMTAERKQMLKDRRHA